MSANQNLKDQIHKYLLDSVSDKIAELQENLQSLEESKKSESKSTAGDKHETGRAMIQIEEDQIKQQLSNAIRNRDQLLAIDPETTGDNTVSSVIVGSLVETSQGLFYIGVGAGKVEVNGSVYFAVSAESPVGGQLIGKRTGDRLEFMQREYEILGVS